MKDQPRIVFTNNAGDLIPKNGLREEKVKVKASNNVYCAMEYNKLSYRPWNYNTNVCIIVPCVAEQAMVILIKSILNNIQKLYGYMNMNILHSSMSQLKNLFEKLLTWSYQIHYFLESLFYKTYQQVMVSEGKNMFEFGDNKIDKKFFKKDDFI